MKECVHILSGQFRGKKIHFPATPGLRPSPSRVRETLFNWLMHDIHGARCLDAFAGSGALGFEAASRGAGSVLMLEQSALAFKALEKNRNSLKNSNIRILQTDTRQYLKQCNEQFDIIFLDPPFAEDWIPDCLEWIAKQAILAEEGLIYIESGEALILNQAHWETLKAKKAGQVHYALYQQRHSTQDTA